MTGVIKPRLIIVAGPNGAGKTTITEKLLRHEWMEDCIYINPDYIAQEEYGDWNSNESIIKAANRAKELREICLENKTSMALETVFSTSEKIDFVRRAINSCFFVRLFFICTNDPSINAQRVALRIMEGGHDVPISKIISRYYKSISNCIEVIPFIDRAYFYDNSRTNTDPILMFKITDGKLSKIYSKITPWAKDIAESYCKQA